jgi:Cytochrome b(N-terminal)/b6/petB
LHLWSVELFMAFLVIHLWGKFWMAAWRGRRALTWITGAVAFQASIVECFTGYLSQQNFDSQWISTNAKDAFNSAGVGAFFNAMSTGQMLLWHVVLIPIVLLALVGAHILLVRVRGVSHPLPGRRAGWRDRAARRAAAAADAAPWRGPTRRYDILKEGTIATGVVLALTLGLAGLLSSPDVPAVTIATWAKLAPADFLGTAASELNDTSKTAAYGPPYNNGTGSVQRLLFSPQTWPGVTQPVNAAQDFVLTPLAEAAASDPQLASAVSAYRAATPARRLAWANAYARAVTKVTFVNGTPALPTASDGPVPVMLASELTLARSGALDASLIAQQPFYGTNFTKPLLFIEDGAYFTARARALHLTGPQWGIMNETGSYPGQPWLWLYTLWYQVPRFSTSANVDLIAIALTGLAVTLLLFVPFIPGLRDIPQLIPLHRLIWRNQHTSQQPPGRQVPGGGTPRARKAAARPAVMPVDGRGNGRLLQRLKAWPEDRVKHAAARVHARAHAPTRPGERLLEVASGAGGDLLAATDRALYHQDHHSWTRLGWEEVDRVDWDEDRRSLMLTGLAPRVPARTVLCVAREWGLPAVATECARSAKVIDQRISLNGGAGARVVARRRPGGPVVKWLVVLDHGLDPADPKIRAELRSALTALRAETGLEDGSGLEPETAAPW